MAMQAATLEVLEQADVPPRQARAIAQAIEIEIAAGHGALATRHDLRDVGNELRLEIAGVRTELKGDIAELRTELKGDIAELRTELKGDIAGLRAELKTDIADLRSELKGDFKTDLADLRGGIDSRVSDIKAQLGHLKGDLARWVLLAILGQTAMLLGIAYFVFDHLAA